MLIRIMRLLGGQFLYGAGLAMTVSAGLGIDPWTVLAEGLSLRTGWGIGWVTNLLGFVVLFLWVPLRQKPGLGTITNILVVGTALQLTLDVLPPARGLVAQLALLLGGITLVALASAIYLGANWGAGPRDGLMTGLNARLGWPIWRARVTVEVTVLAAGWLLGGTVGLGTVMFALLIGPLTQVAMRILRVSTRQGPASRATRTTRASMLPE